MVTKRIPTPHSIAAHVAARLGIISQDSSLIEDDLRLSVPHPKQSEILNSSARFKVIACGRRFGKTELAMHMLTPVAYCGKYAAYFAPTYRMCSEVWRSFKNVLRSAMVYKNEMERRIETRSGGVLECWSLDNADSVRGRKYHYIFVDEAAMVPTQDVWTDVLRPLLTDYRGKAAFASTPKGRNWFFTLYQQAQDPLHKDWAAWNYTTLDNPYIDPREVEDAQAMLPARSFEQEYLAQFTEDAGMVFRNVDAVSVAEPGRPQSGHRYVFGVDWARDYDFTVISVMDVDERRQVYLDRFNQVSWTLQQGRLKSLFNIWKPKAVYAEENSIGSPNIDALCYEGLPVRAFKTKQSTKRQIIEALALAIERNEITLLNDAVQKLELKSYQQERLDSGVFRYSAPVGGHDDTVIATALAWYGVSRTAGVTVRDNPFY